MVARKFFVSRFTISIQLPHSGRLRGKKYLMNVSSSPEHYVLFKNVALCCPKHSMCMLISEVYRGVD